MKGFFYYVRNLTLYIFYQKEAENKLLEKWSRTEQIH